VLRGKYAYATLDQEPNEYGWQPSGSDKYFCSQNCKYQWLDHNMENIEHGRPIEFIRHRRESQGYAKVTEDQESWSGRTYTSTSIKKVDNGQIVE
jgi:YHS domain-containing protein